MSNTILTFQELLLMVSSVALNKDQNQAISPVIFSAAARLSTDFILMEIKRVFPYSQSILDVARPFLKRKLIPVVDGIAVVPDDYSYILSISIAVNKNMTEGCNCKETGQCNENNDDNCPDEPVQKASIRKEKCYFQKVNIVDSDQYDDATQNLFMPPSMKHPIAMFVDRTHIKICPIDGITYVEARYLKQPLKYNIAYTIMADDTWQLNTADPSFVELEWERNAAPQLFKCMCSLLGLHTRDGNFMNWQNELKQLGMF